MTPHVVAVELALAAEHLQRAALAAAGLGGEFESTAMAWTREVDRLLADSIEWHEVAVQGAAA